MAKRTAADDTNSNTGQGEHKNGAPSLEEKRQTDERAARDAAVAVLKKEYFALMDRNKKAFLDCFTPSTNADFLDVYFGATAEAFAFKASIQRAYGAEGVRRFEDFAGEAGMVAFRLPPLDKNEQWWEKLDVRILDEDRVLCTDPYTMEALAIVRTDVGWRIDLSSRKLEPEVERQSTFKRSLEETAEDIGKPGVTVDDLRRKLGTYQ